MARLAIRDEKTPAQGTPRKLFITLFCLVFAGMGLTFTGLLVSEAYKDARTYTWKATPCQILSSQVIEPDQNSRQNKIYEFDVEYQYDYAGRSYQSSRYSLSPPNFPEYRKALLLQQAFPAEKQATCYVNPSSPSEAILHRGSFWIALFLPLPLFFVLIGFGGIYIAWRSPAPTQKYPAKKEASISEKARGRSGTRLVGCFLIPFFSIFLIVGCIASYAFFIRPILKIQSARSWNETPCVVLSSSIRVHHGDDSTSYSPNILYRYTVNNKEFKSNQYRFGSAAAGSHRAASALVSAHPAGKKTVCYVNPSDPTEAVLNRNFTPQLWLGLIPLIFVLVGLAGVTAGVRKLLKPKPDSPSPGRPATPAAASPSADRARPSTRSTLRPKSTPTAKFLGLTLFALIWNGILSVFLWQVIKGWTERGGFMEKYILPVFLIPFVLVGLLIIVGAIHSFLAIFNPKPLLRVSSASAPLGGTLRLDWEITGRLHRLKRLEILLEGREEATYRRGTRSSTDRHVFATIPIAQLTNHMDMRAGHRQIQIPTTFMHSFNAPHNKIVWSLHLKGDIPRWPDIDEEFPLEILPQT